MVISPSINEGIGGTEYKIAGSIDTPLPVIPITRANNFVFNTELLKFEKVVILDYIEYDWNWPLEETGTHLWGYNTNKFKHHFSSDEWMKFDNWVCGLKEVVYFKRELLNGDKSNVVHSLEYPSWITEFQTVSKNDFENRKIDLFNFWGRSHEARLIFHSKVWEHASKHGGDVLDNIFYFNDWIKYEQSGRKYITLNIPFYGRTDISNILSISGLSKLSIAHPGAGRKTFRENEVSNNSVLVTWDNNLEYAYPWIANENCIKFDKLGNEFEAIEAALTNPNLYEIYKEGKQNAQKYMITNYINDYLLPIINA